jgi:Fe-S cluster assembly iron-binding protein IscA
MINLTSTALTEIQRLMAERQAAGQLLRFGVKDGGCSGLTYSMDFDALAGAQLGMTDPQARRDAVNAMQAILAEDLPVLPLYYTARVVVFNAAVFDNWTYTPGGWGGGIPMPYNKHQFIVGTPTGLAIRE